MGFPPGGSVPGSAAGPAPAANGPHGMAGPVAAEGARGPVAVPRPRVSTGDPRVDDAVARLDDLAGLPVAEHLAVFEYVHERLTEALGDLDVHAPARPGGKPPGPGAPGG